MPIDEPIKTDPTSSEDLSNQYQDVLDQYAKQLDSNPVPPEASTPTEIPTPIETPIITEVHPEPPVSTETFVPPEPPPLSISSIVTPPPIPPTTSSSAIPKILFFISLFTFLVVIAANLYVIYLNQKPISTPTKPTESATSPTPQTSSAQCTLNDKKYNVAESFPAADGCNTCTCLEDLTITCTENDCATISPTVTSTSTSSAIPATWKTYENKTLGFSLSIPESWTSKYEVSVLGNTAALFEYKSKTEKYMLFAITKLFSKAWQDLQKDEREKGLAKYLGTNKDSVYYSNRSLDNPYSGLDGDTYQSMSADINQILSTFKFL